MPGSSASQTVLAPGATIAQPASLRDKLGRRFSGVDADAIAKAEAALKSLSGQFDTWLQDELDKLEAARLRFRRDGEPALDTLYSRAHDLKGVGATYQFPLVSRIAGSLAKLIDPQERAGAPSPTLVDAHVDALRAIVRDGVRDAEHPVGQAVAQALEQRVAAHMAEANDSSTAP